MDTEITPPKELTNGELNRVVYDKLLSVVPDEVITFPDASPKSFSYLNDNMTLESTPTSIISNLLNTGECSESHEGTFSNNTTTPGIHLDQQKPTSPHTQQPTSELQAESISRQSSSSALAAVLTSLHTVTHNKLLNGHDPKSEIITKSEKETVSPTLPVQFRGEELVDAYIPIGNQVYSTRERTRSLAQISVPSKLRCSLVRHAYGALQNPSIHTGSRARVISSVRNPQRRWAISPPSDSNNAQFSFRTQYPQSFSSNENQGFNIFGSTESNLAKYGRAEKINSESVVDYHSLPTYVEEANNNSQNPWIVHSGNNIWIESTQLQNVPYRHNMANYSKTGTTSTIGSSQTSSAENQMMEDDEDMWNGTPLIISALPPLQPQSYIPCPPNFYFTNPNVPNAINGGGPAIESAQQATHQGSKTSTKKKRHRIRSSGTSTTSSPSSRSSSTEQTRGLPYQTKPKKFFCSLCAKGFTQKGGLVNHERIHRGERPFVCRKHGCGKSFVQKCNLTRHERVHTGEKPYQCPIAKCGKRFNRKWGLTQHMKQSHEEVDQSTVNLAPTPALRNKSSYTKNTEMPALPELQISPSNMQISQDPDPESSILMCLEKLSPPSTMLIHTAQTSPRFTFATTHPLNGLGFIQGFSIDGNK